MPSRHLTEEEIGSIALLTMTGGEWVMDHVVRNLCDYVDIVFRGPEYSHWQLQSVRVRLGLFNLTHGSGDMDLMGAMTITMDIVKDLNAGDADPLRQRRFNLVKIGE